MKEWTSEIIDDLCAAKAAGGTFEDSWAAARLAHRPRGRDRGIPADTLFEASQEAEPLVDFLYRACRDAWFGFKPQLRVLGALAESDVFPTADMVPWAPPGRSRKARAA